MMTKANCPLCDEARLVLEPLAKRAGLAVQEADILTDEALFVRYRDRIPVLCVDGHDVLYAHFRRTAVERALGLTPPARVLCLDLPELEGPLAAAGMQLVGGWEARPAAAVVPGERLQELHAPAGTPVIAVGSGPGTGRAEAFLQEPLYPPDLIRLLDDLLAHRRA